MAEGSARQPGSVVHGNPVTAAGFAMLPMAVLLRKDLSVGARMVYAYLKHLAWKGDGDPAPLHREIADALSISERSVREYLRELRAAPTLEGAEDEGVARLVESERRGLGLPNLYVVNDPTADPSIRNGSPRRTGRKTAPVPTRARDRAVKTEELETSTANAVLVAAPAKSGAPPLVKVGGRNLGYDALADVCQIDPGSPRTGEIVTALNGRRGSPGIRQLFWVELRRWRGPGDGEQEQAFDEIVKVEPERFEKALALGIRAKAAKYRDRMEGALLTPTALAKWWLDLERMTGAGGRVTGADVRHLDV